MKSKPLPPAAGAERSIVKKYRDKLWNPFIAAVKRYELVNPGDKIAVCISGGKDSMLLAKLMQILQKYSEIPFELEFIVMDPGYTAENRANIEQNARRLEIPARFFETRVLDISQRSEGSPCYLCARMRRGHLYAQAKRLGCNKIALGHHMNDVIETTVMGMFYGAQLQSMMPKLKSRNFEGMELIRPLYCTAERDIVAWARYNGLEFIRCACGAAAREDGSKRAEVKALIERLRRDNPDIEKRIFRAVHAVNIDTFPAFKENGKTHSFLENYK